MKGRFDAVVPTGVLSRIFQNDVIGIYTYHIELYSTPVLHLSGLAVGRKAD